MDQIAKYFIILVLIGNVFQLKAQNIEFGSVEDAIRLSLEKNPDLKIYKLKQEKIQQEYKNKKRSALPTFSGSLDYVDNIERQTSVLPGELFGQASENVNVQFGTKYNYTAGISTSMDLLNFERKLEVKLSKLNAELQAAEKDVYMQLLKEQTAMYYYGALVVKHALEIHNENLSSSQDILKVTQQHFEEGIIDLPSLNQAKITVNNIRQTIKTNQNLFDTYITQLRTLLELTTNDTLLFSENIDIESNQIDFVQDLGEDNNLMVFDLQKQQSELDVRLKKAAFLPKLTAIQYIGAQQFSDDFGVKFSGDSWYPNISFGLNLTIPILNISKNRGNFEIAKINDRINEQIILNERQKSQNADDQLLKDHQSGLVQLDLAKRNYQLYKENVELSLQKYNNGVIS